MLSSNFVLPNHRCISLHDNHYQDTRCFILQLKSDKGRVYLIPSIARTELDDVIELIRTKCDLVHHGDEKTEIMTTGAGCNLFKTRLEQGLDIRYYAAMVVVVVIREVGGRGRI